MYIMAAAAEAAVAPAVATAREAAREAARAAREAAREAARIDQERREAVEVTRRLTAAEAAVTG